MSAATRRSTQTMLSGTGRAEYNFAADDAPWLRVAYAAVSFAVFLAGCPILRLGSLTITASDVALLTAIVIFVGRGRIRRQPFGSLTGLWLTCFVAMIGGLFVSSAVNGDTLRWLNVASQYCLALLFVPYVLFSLDLRFAQRLPVIFVVGVSVSQLIGIVSFSLFTFQDTHDLLGPGFITGNGRIGAMAGEPNPNGALIAFSVPMLVYAWAQRLLRPALVFICAGLLACGLLLSASFTGFVATAVALSVALAIAGIRHLLITVAVIVALVSLFFATGIALPEVFRERVASAIATGDLSQAGTFVARSELIKEAWTLTQDTLFLGMGVDQYREVSRYGAPVHNLHLLLWTEGGAIAFAGLLMLLGQLLLLAIWGVRRHRAQSAMACAAVVVFLIYTMSIPHMYSRFWVLPVFVGLCTIYAMPSSYRTHVNTRFDGASAPYS